MGKQKKSSKDKRHVCKNTNLSEVYSKIIQKIPSHMAQKMRQKDTCSLSRLLNLVNRPADEYLPSLDMMRSVIENQQSRIKGQAVEEEGSTSETEGNSDSKRMLNFDSEASGTMLEMPVAYTDFPWMAEKQNQIDFFL